MKAATFIVLSIGIVSVGCSFKSETVQKPVPATETQRTVYTDPYAPPASTTTTVTTPAR